jgi:hypothetical protein
MQWLLCLRTARWSKKQWSCKPEIVGRRIIHDPGEVEDGIDDWMTASERAPLQAGDAFEWRRAIQSAGPGLQPSNKTIFEQERNGFFMRFSHGKVSVFSVSNYCTSIDMFVFI